MSAARVRLMLCQPHLHTANCLALARVAHWRFTGMNTTTITTIMTTQQRPINA
jgi:hypothetical protein